MGGYEIGTCTVQELSRIVIDQEGAALNGQRTSDVTVSQILNGKIAHDNILKKELHSADYLRLKLGNRMDAERISGFTIFGHGFGQHTCDIITRFYC